MRLIFAAGALATALALSAPASAGEITGNNEDVDPNGKSICSYSGLNDVPEGDLEGPPGKTQSFGQSVRMGLRDPTAFNGPDAFSFHPGFLCNATNMDVSDWHP
jgi:hypothetical protein